MKITALITALVLGSTTVAAADVRTEFSATAHLNASFSYGTPSRPQVRDHRDRRPVVRPPVVQPAAVRPAPVQGYFFDGYREPIYNPANTRVTDNLSLYTGPIAATRSYDGWVAITEPTRIDKGREFINIGVDAGRFRTLRLEQVAGSSHITAIGIEFMSSSGQVEEMQTIKLDDRLDRRNAITVDLNGNLRYINRVIVYGTTANGSAYQVLAQ